MLVRASVAAMKHHDQKQTGEERVYLANPSALLLIINRNQGRNLEAGTTQSRADELIVHTSYLIGALRCHHQCSPVQTMLRAKERRKEVSRKKG